MNDVDTIRAMLDKADVRYEITAPDPDRYERNVEAGDLREGTVSEIITAGEMGGPEKGAGNLGYMGFFTVFGFDKNGNLISVGAWE